MNKLKSAFISIVFILSVMYFSTSPAIAGIINGDFSDENAGEWVISENGVAVLSDIAAGGNGFAVLYDELRYEDEASFSTLSQVDISLLPGETQLVFDLIMEKTEEGSETDTFTATFGTEEYELLSSDFSGTTYIETVVIDLSGLASGTYYTLTFQLENEYDGILTSVYIDNIHFVPVPGAFLLAAIGLFSTAVSRKRLKA